jgi:hypothetical protein
MVLDSTPIWRTFFRLQISLLQPYETFMSSLPASPLSRIFLSSVPNGLCPNVKPKVLVLPASMKVRRASTT